MYYKNITDICDYDLPLCDPPLDAEIVDAEI